MSRELPSTTEVNERIGSLIQQPDFEPVRDEVNALLRSYSNIDDPVERRMRADALRDSGLMPDLVLAESEALDVLGDNDGVTKEDLRYILSNPGAFDPTTRLAADYSLQNFAPIADSIWSVFEDTEIEQDEFQAYQKEPGENQAAPELRPVEEGYDDDSEWGEDSEDEEESYEDNEARDEEDEKEELVERLDSLLAGSDASASKVFGILEKLSKEGMTEITLHDQDGKEFTGRLVVEPVVPGSSRNYVHLFVPDESGREMIALRAVGVDGVYSQEVDARGNTVGFIGDRFSRAGKIRAEI